MTAAARDFVQGKMLPGLPPGESSGTRGTSINNGAIAPGRATPLSPGMPTAGGAPTRRGRTSALAHTSPRARSARSKRCDSISVSLALSRSPVCRSRLAGSLAAARWRALSTNSTSPAPQAWPRNWTVRLSPCFAIVTPRRTRAGLADSSVSDCLAAPCHREAHGGATGREKDHRHDALIRPVRQCGARARF